MTPLIGSFSIERPQYEVDQEILIEWIAEAHACSLETSQATSLRNKLHSLGLGRGIIDRRGSVVSDCLHHNWKDMEIYALTKETPSGAPLDVRMAFFDRAASEVFERFFPNSNSLFSHLIHVTCTGYVSPSAAQKIVSKRGTNTLVTHAYHMGCYAAIPALRMALGHWQVEQSASNIVHTELCTLHMNPNLHTTEQLVVQSLFGDGFISYSFASHARGLKVLAIHEQIIPVSTMQMTWQCHSFGFYLTIAKEVPVSISRSLNSFLSELFKKTQMSIKKEIYFAIHPGGPRIIEQIAKLLQLQPNQYQHSLGVLKEYGNMSSATLPHIWSRILDDSNIPSGSQILSLAFGPGLSIAGALFEKV